MKDTSKIYVDIASLLDLRQAALYQACIGDPVKLDGLVKYLVSDDYNFREQDRFSIVPEEDYAAASSAITPELISYSVVTHILTVLKTKLDNLEKRNKFHSEDKDPEILLNIYPAILTDEHIGILKNTLFVKLKSDSKITIINMSPQELTPYFIKSTGIITALIYNFREWADLHIANLEKTKIPDILLYFPALSYGDLTDEEEKSISKTGFKDLFAYTEYLLSSVACIQFLPPVFYSNLITASLYLEKLGSRIASEPLSEKSMELEENVDSSTAV